MLFQKLMGKGPTSMISPSAPKTLWAWGTNSSGRLGLGDAESVYRSSPVQVGTLATWSAVAVASGHSLALKTDGTLWAWAHAALGSLGTGDVVLRSSPVQGGALTTWGAIAAG